MDLDNTLLDFSRAERCALESALREQGIDCTDALAAHYAAINDRYWKRLERGEVDRTSLKRLRFVDFCREASLPCDPELLSVRYVERLTEQGQTLPGAEALCRTLQAMGRIYFVTNGNKTVQAERVRRSGLDRYAEAIFISEDLGVEKPARAYFDAVRQAIPAFCPARTLLIGDSLTSDLQGAYNAGLDGCWYNPGGRPLPPEWPAEQRIAYVVASLEEIPAVARGEREPERSTVG
jgi:2-haloacid dehalogenase